MSPKWSFLQLSQIKFSIHFWPHAECPSSLIWLPFKKVQINEDSHYASFPVPAFFCLRSEYFPHYLVLPLQWKSKFCIHIKRGGTKIVYRLIFIFMVSKWEDNYDLNNKPFHKYNLLLTSLNIILICYHPPQIHVYFTLQFNSLFQDVHKIQYSRWYNNGLLVHIWATTNSDHIKSVQGQKWKILTWFHIHCQPTFIIHGKRMYTGKLWFTGALRVWKSNLIRILFSYLL